LATTEAMSTQLGGSQRIHRHNAAFLDLYNCNDVEDVNAVSREAAFVAEYNKLISHKHIVEMHHKCCANYVDRLCKMNGISTDEDQRFLKHIMRAGKYWNPA